MRSRPLTVRQRDVLERMSCGWVLCANLERCWLERDAPYLHESVMTNTFMSLVGRKLVSLESKDGSSRYHASRFDLTQAGIAALKQSSGGA